MDNSIASVAGIDTSKDELVLNVDGRARGGFANTRAGLERLREFLPTGTQVHLEASGGCDRLAREVLQGWGFAVHVHNPRKVRRAADARGFIAKNDAMDAKALVEVGPFVKSKPAKSAFQEMLCDVSRTIKNLKDQSALAKLRMKTPQLPAACVKSYEALVKASEKQVKILEKEYLKLLKKSEFAARHELARTVPGIGPATSRVLSCELPADLGAYVPKQIGSYAGMAPMDDESGKRKGARHIKKGNVHVKAAMYMPAIWSIAHEEWARNLYSRLRTYGKTHDQAIIPIMRKILIRAVAVMQRGSAYEADPPKNPTSNEP